MPTRLPEFKNKRSSIYGKTPTVSQLDGGQIAINVSDGSLYTSKLGVNSTVDVNRIGEANTIIVRSMGLNGDGSTKTSNTQGIAPPPIGSVVSVKPHPTMNNGEPELPGYGVCVKLGTTLYPNKAPTVTGIVIGVSQVPNEAICTVAVGGTIDIPPGVVVIPQNKTLHELIGKFLYLGVDGKLVYGFSELETNLVSIGTLISSDKIVLDFTKNGVITKGNSVFDIDSGLYIPSSTSSVTSPNYDILDTRYALTSNIGISSVGDPWSEVLPISPSAGVNISTFNGENQHSVAVLDQIGDLHVLSPTFNGVDIGYFYSKVQGYGDKGLLSTKNKDVIRSSIRYSPAGLDAGIGEYIRHCYTPSQSAMIVEIYKVENIGGTVTHSFSRHGLLRFSESFALNGVTLLDLGTNLVDYATTAFLQTTMTSPVSNSTPPLSFSVALSYLRLGGGPSAIINPVQSNSCILVTAFGFKDGTDSNIGNQFTFEIRNIDLTTGYISTTGLGDLSTQYLSESTAPNTYVPIGTGNIASMVRNFFPPSPSYSQARRALRFSINAKTGFFGRTVDDAATRNSAIVLYGTGVSEYGSGVVRNVSNIQVWTNRRKKVGIGSLTRVPAGGSMTLNNSNSIDLFVSVTIGVSSMAPSLLSYPYNTRITGIFQVGLNSNVATINGSTGVRAMMLTPTTIEAVSGSNAYGYNTAGLGQTYISIQSDKIDYKFGWHPNTGAWAGGGGIGFTRSFILPDNSCLFTASSSSVEDGSISPSFIASEYYMLGSPSKTSASYQYSNATDYYSYSPYVEYSGSGYRYNSNRRQNALTVDYKLKVKESPNQIPIICGPSYTGILSLNANLKTLASNMFGGGTGVDNIGNNQIIAYDISRHSYTWKNWGASATGTPRRNILGGYYPQALVGSTSNSKLKVQILKHNNGLDTFVKTLENKPNSYVSYSPSAVADRQQRIVNLNSCIWNSSSLLPTIFGVREYSIDLVPGYKSLPVNVVATDPYRVQMDQNKGGRNTIEISQAGYNSMGNAVITAVAPLLATFLNNNASAYSVSQTITAADIKDIYSEFAIKYTVETKDADTTGLGATKLIGNISVAITIRPSVLGPKIAKPSRHLYSLSVKYNSTGTINTEIISGISSLVVRPYEDHIAGDQTIVISSYFESTISVEERNAAGDLDSTNILRCITFNRDGTIYPRVFEYAPVGSITGTSIPIRTSGPTTFKNAVDYNPYNLTASFGKIGYFNRFGGEDIFNPFQYDLSWSGKTLSVITPPSAVSIEEGAPISSNSRVKLNDIVPIGDFLIYVDSPISTLIAGKQAVAYELEQNRGELPLEINLAEELSISSAANKTIYTYMEHNEITGPRLKFSISDIGESKIRIFLGTITTDSTKITSIDLKPAYRILSHHLSVTPKPNAIPIGPPTATPSTWNFQ